MSRRRNRRRNAGVMRLRYPVIVTAEDISVATADSAQTTYLYAPSYSGSAVQEAQKITFLADGLPCIFFRGGNSQTAVYAVVRKIPAGYSLPSVAIGSNSTVYQDTPNVLAYGFCSFVPSLDPQSIDMHWLKNTTLVHPGDQVILQLTANISSSGMIASAQFCYSLS